MGQSKGLSNAQIIRAALVVLLGFLASGVLGFIRQGVLAAQFGAGEALDAFITAQRIPEIIFVLVAGGALGSSFIPIYSRQREHDEQEAWRLASAVMTLSALAATVLALGVVITAPWIVRDILLVGASADKHELTITMMRWMMVTPIIFSISGLVMGILQSHGLFILPSLAISMNSIGIMIGALFIAPFISQVPYSTFNDVLALAMPTQYQGLPIDQVRHLSVYGLAYGAILSAVLHLVIQLPGLWQIRARLRFLPNPRLDGVWDVLRLMGPRVLGLAIVQINFVINIILTSGMTDGSLTVLNVAFTLMFFALGIIGQSVGSAVFPTLSALYAENDMDGFKDRLSRAMRSVLFLAYPATAIFIVLGVPVVSIFERGEWTAIHSQGAGWALIFYALGIAGFALLEILSRAFYAIADTWTPVAIGIGAMVSNIILSVWFIQFIGDPNELARGSFAGLALANALTTLAEALVLWWVLRRRIGNMRDQWIFDGSWRTILASVLMASVLWGLDQVLPIEGFLLAVIAVPIGGIVFFAISIGLNIEEAKIVPMMLLSRFRRSR